jgi:hypothetical protein
MKTEIIIEKFTEALREKFLWLLLVMALLWSAVPARAQIGTYVTPRINTVFNQWVTNGGSYTLYGTNWLSPSAWHNINWMLSEAGTNNIGTNQVGGFFTGSAGSGNSYTNSAAGTNFVYSSTLLGWTNNLTATTNSTGTWTNMTQNVGDGWLWFKGTFTVLSTNVGGFNLQIDQIVTP